MSRFIPRSRLPIVATAIALTSLLVGVALVAGLTNSQPPTTVGVVQSPSAPPSPTPRPSIPIPSASPTPSPSPSPIPSPTPLPAGVADLTGVHVEDSVAHRLPIAVLIDDNRVARPQSGFNAASIVYQAPADGGETRYMFVFQEYDVRSIGPIRSGRIYFLHWASEIKAGIAHYGGDNISRWYLRTYDGQLFTNVDALGKGAKAFHRIKSRKAPHNGYSSTKELRAMAIKLGGPETMAAKLVRRPFIDESPLAARGKSHSIRIPYRTGLVEYRYDPKANVYERRLDGKWQIDPADNRRVRPRNVVVLFQSFKTDSKIEPGHARPVVGAIGTGRAWIFREGRLLKATWSKTDETAPTRLLDADGHDIPLVRGQTFFQVVPETTKVTTGG